MKQVTGCDVPVSLELMMCLNKLGEQSGFRLGNMTVGDMNVVRGEEGGFAGSSTDGWETICVGRHIVRRGRRYH